jgi:hypothetical protein
VKIRVETIAHYLEKQGAGIIAAKKAAAPPGCPLLTIKKTLTACGAATPPTAARDK